MSSKYSPDAGRYVESDIALTDHAIHRYQMRTPQDCDIPPRLAWARGEHIKHPRVVQSDDVDRPPVDAVVYREADWGICFLVDQDIGQLGAPKVVVTTVHIRGFDHKPTRAYLRAYGPHGGGV
jgi:hypothetical protein